MPISHCDIWGEKNKKRKCGVVPYSGVPVRCGTRIVAFLLIMSTHCGPVPSEWPCPALTYPTTLAGGIRVLAGGLELRIFGSRLFLFIACSCTSRTITLIVGIGRSGEGHIALCSGVGYWGLITSFDSWPRGQ